MRNGNRLAGAACLGLLAAALFATGASAQMDHSLFIQNYQGAQTCEGCHPGSIAQLQQSVHYKFESPILENYLFTEEGEPVDIEVSGKYWKLCGFPTTVPQFNWMGSLKDDPATPHVDQPGGCAKCHIGIGIKPYTETGLSEPQANEANNVDCLICHAENYTRRFYVATANGEPELNASGAPIVFTVPRVDGEFDYGVYLEAAQSVGPTQSEYCNRCHAAAGGGRVQLDDQQYSFKRASVYAPSEDVHAAAGMTCSACHNAGDHKTKRPRNNDIYAYDTEPVEDMCAQCHGEAPHEGNPMYNGHAEFISCTACHATSNGGAVYKDFSVVVPPDPNDPLGLYGVEVTMAGDDFTMDYLWFNGTVHGEIVPAGSRGDGKIHPYKSTFFNQPVDDSGHPVPVRWGPIYTKGDVAGAAAAGRQLYDALWSEELGARTGLPPVPGEFTQFKEGRCGYFSISHGITKDEALTCSCCHHPNSLLDFEELGFSEEEATTLTSMGFPDDCSRVRPSSKVGDWIFR